MRAKPTEAISGMYMPSGENMWASPADDKSEDKVSFENELGNQISISIEELKDSGKNSEGEKIDFDAIKITMKGPDSVMENTVTEVEAQKLHDVLMKFLKKEAIGLTSIPGEIQNDYNSEQSPHIKDPHNVGIIDVESPVSLHPINKAEDSHPENKMEELLQELIEHLESKGYADKVNLIKKAYPGQTGQVPGYGAPFGSRPVSVKTPAKIPAKPLVTEDRLQTSDPYKDEFGEGYQSFSSIADMVEAGLLTKSQADWLISQSRNQSFPPQFLQKELGLDIEYAKQLSDLLSEEASRPQQAARSRDVSGWDRYSQVGGPDAAALARAWQAGPPQGYDTSFDAFKTWYSDKYQELGRHFSPREALSMIQVAEKPAVQEKATAPEELAKEGPAVPGETEVTEELSVTPTRENIMGSLERLMRGMPMRTPGAEENVLESGRVSRMTKRYLRGIGSDRTIRTQEDQEKVIGLATSAISQVTLDGKTFEETVREELSGLEGNEARKVFDGLVWQYLRRAWAAYGSLAGKEVSDRREERRMRRLDRQTRRQIDRAERRS